MLFFFPRDVLNEILNVIESVSKIFLPTLAISVCPHVLFYLSCNSDSYVSKIMHI